MAACQTLFAILDLEPEKDNGTYKAEPAKGELEFKNVSFAYQGKEELALNNISLACLQENRCFSGTFWIGQINHC